MRSRKVKRGTAMAVCDPEPQANAQCDIKISQIKRELMFASQDCESKPCGEDNSSGLSVLEETDCQTLVCGHCGKSFLQRHLLTRHIREVHRPSLNLVCKECGKKCSSTGGLYHHMKTHVPKIYECAECGRKFERKKTLALHWHRIHGDGTLVQREFHVNSKSPKPSSGSDQVLRKCRDCDKTYKSAAGLSRHRAATHLQKFAHSCNMCGQAFVQKTSLLRHQKVHDKARPFQCGYCIGSFRDKWHLTQHERIHTGARPYECSICEEAYRLNIELQEHICADHENLERKCPECSHTCQTFGALASHWKQKHAYEWVCKNSTKDHSSMCSNEEIPILSIEWRNKHSAKWANPKTRKKRERINIALLQELADASSVSEYEDSMNNVNGKLAVCNNNGTSHTGSLSQDGNHLSLNLSSLASDSVEEFSAVYVPSIEKVKEKVMEGEETVHVTTGHHETKVKGVQATNRSMVPQGNELDIISSIPEVSGVKYKNSRGKEKKSRKPAGTLKIKLCQKKMQSITK